MNNLSSLRCIVLLWNVTQIGDGNIAQIVDGGAGKQQGGLLFCQCGVYFLIAPLLPALISPMASLAAITAFITSDVVVGSATAATGISSSATA
jgi:hypothetical protein